MAKNLALQGFEKHRAEFLNGFDTVDVMLSPVTPMMPFGHDHISPFGRFDADKQKIAEMMAYTSVPNVYGLPAMSVPCGFIDGLPVGAHFMAPMGEDDLLFQLAYGLEEAAPWNCYADIVIG